MGVAAAPAVPTYATWQNNTHEKWWKDPGLRANVMCCVVLYLGIYSYGYVRRAFF